MPLKASVEAELLELLQRHEEGKIISTYATTEQGKWTIAVEREPTDKRQAGRSR